MAWTEWEDEYGKWKKRVNENGIEELLHVERSQKWYDENSSTEPQPEPPTTEILQEDLNAVAELTAQNTEDNAAIAETVAYNLEDSTALGETLALALVEIENLKAEIAVLKGA